MSTYDDRPRTDAEEETVTVTPFDDEGAQATHREPLAEDGQPIFPPVGDTDPDAARDADVEAGVRDDQRIDQGIDQQIDLRDADVAEVHAGTETPTGYAAPGGYTPPAEYDQDGTGFSTPPSGTDEPAALDEPDAPAALDEPDAPAHRVDDHDQAWLDLQGTFVDDPAAAVRQAGERVERELADFRGRLDSADTEALRTAFRQFRDLSAILR